MAVVLTAWFVGCLIAMVACYVQPRHYESVAPIEEQARPGQSIPLAPAHVAIMVDNHGFDDRWDLTFEESIKLIQKSVAIQHAEGITTITGRFPSAHDAKLIVETIAKTYPGAERARSWSGTDGPVIPFSEEESARLLNINRLRSLILDEVWASGGLPPGTIIADRHTAAIGISDLKRRIDVYRNLNAPPWQIRTG